MIENSSVFRESDAKGRLKPHYIPGIERKKVEA